MPSQIRIGSKVSACVGPLQDISQAEKDKRKKRSCQRLFGTVVQSSADQKWTVYWEDIGRASFSSSSLLKDEGQQANIDLGKINAILDSDSSLVFKSQKEMDVFFGRLNVSPTPIIHQANRELQPTIGADPQAALQQVTNPGDVNIAPQPDSVQLETATDSILVPTNEPPQDSPVVMTAEIEVNDLDPDALIE